MSVTFFTPGAELGKYRLTENPDGSITVHLNDGEGVAAGWCTITGRADAAALMKMGADADALFIRRKAADAAHDVIVPPAEAAVCYWCGEKPSDGVTLLFAQDRWQCSDGDACRERCIAQEETAADDVEHTPAGPSEPAWQAAINAELSEGALAGGVPLESLAPEHEDEAQA